MNIRSFFRPVIKTISPYVPTPTIEEFALERGIDPSQVVKLDAGENTYVGNKKLGRYPDPLARRLTAKLAAYAAVRVEQVMVCNGSDESIDLICRLFLDPGDQLVNFPPTFPMYQVSATLQGATIVNVPRDQNFHIDMEAARAALVTAKLAFLATPNNPTGTVTMLRDIETLLKVGTPIVVDEAYIEYGGESAVALLKKYENLMIIRTLSKWAGLAGVRIGYVLASPMVIKKLLAIKPPYNTSTPSQELGILALDRKDVILKRIERAKRRRAWMLDALSKLPNLSVIPSQGATIVIVPTISAEKMRQQFSEKGILVRNVSSPYLPNAVRINLGTQAEMKRFLSACSEIVCEV